MIHELPIAQLLALSACAAWTQGMEPTDGTYEDYEFDRTLARVKSARQANLDTSSPT